MEQICKNCIGWQPNGGVLGVGYCTKQKWVYRKPSQSCKRFEPNNLILANIDWIQAAQDYTMHLELTYSKTCDWRLHIWKKGCGSDGGDLEICNIQDCDLRSVLEEGAYFVKQYLGRKIFGGRAE